jgi:hypothetical protein
VLLALVTACGASTQPAAPASPAAAPAPLGAGDAAVVGTVVRFTSATTSVDVTIGEDSGFYYNTSGVGYSDQTLHIGTNNASLEQLTQLEGDDVTAQIVE